jgi:hypothetical protein
LPPFLPLVFRGWLATGKRGNFMGDPSNSYPEPNYSWNGQILPPLGLPSIPERSLPKAKKPSHLSSPLRAVRGLHDRNNFAKLESSFRW